jgi:hypothetical protein
MARRPRSGSSADLGEMVNLAALVNNWMQALVHWMRIYLAEPRVRSIYSMLERWLGNLMAMHGGRREGLSHRRGDSWPQAWQTHRRWPSLSYRFTRRVNPPSCMVWPDNGELR